MKANTIRTMVSTTLALLVLLGLVAALVSPARADGPAGPGTGGSVFLPLLANGPAGGGNPPPDQPPPAARAALFVEPDKKTGSSALKIDAAGGHHLAYAYYVPTAEHPLALYQYCPPAADCTKGENWKGVSMADGVNEVQLAVTAAGQPRLLIRTVSSHSKDGTGNDFLYAACDADCTNPANWKGTYVLYNWGTATFDISDNTTPQRSFALDPQGRPRFVYQDRNYGIEPDHYGAFYVWCDANCTEHTPENPTWFQVQIGLSTQYDAEYYAHPALTFTKEGGPRLATHIHPMNGEPDGLYYVACDTNCEDSSSWNRTHLGDRGSTPEVAWDIEVDSAGRPRIAQYEGDQLGDAGDRLLYRWCQADCLNPAGWGALDLGLGLTNGVDADLALDTAGRPRIGYIHSAGGGLGYAWCNGDCTTASGWQAQVIETRADLEKEWELPRPSHCDAGLWDSMTPVLALDPAGSPRVAYDSAYNTRCWYDDDPTDNIPPYLKFHQLWHTVRLVLFPQP